MPTSHSNVFPFALGLFCTALHAQVPPAGTASPNKVDTALAHADRLVAPLIDSGVAVGVAVGVLYDGKTGTRGYGLVRKGGSKKPDASTLYEIGSITKVFTGILLADAVHRKLVQLSDPIQKFVPKGTTVPRFKTKEIRLSHLTSHTSALPRMPVNFGGADPNDPFAHYNRDMLYEGLGQIKLTRAPGKSYVYSNLAAGLLGQLLVDIQKAPDYQTLMRARIGEPLGLRDTFIRLDKPRAARFAPAYTNTGRAGRSWTFKSLAGAGAIRSTVTDLLTFSAAALGMTKLDGDKAHLKEPFRLSQQPIYKAGLLSKLLNKAPKPATGCGWHIGPGKNLIWHNGATSGYRAMMLLDTQQKCAVIALSNTTSEFIGQVTQQIYVATTGRPVKPVTIRQSIDLPLAKLKSLVGRYQLSPVLIFDVTLKDGVLGAQLTGQPEFTLLPASETRFFYRAVKAEIEFTIGADGKASKLMLFQNGMELPAPRIQ